MRQNGCQEDSAGRQSQSVGGKTNGGTKFKNQTDKLGGHSEGEKTSPSQYPFPGRKNRETSETGQRKECGYNNQGVKGSNVNSGTCFCKSVQYSIMNGRLRQISVHPLSHLLMLLMLLAAGVGTDPLLWPI